MMRARVRSTLLTAGLVLFAIAGWLYFAPAQIGGSTTYVITSGISMEPRFHSGDLALVRPAGAYRVGEVVAYRSSVLHVTVLHRIIAIRGGQYVFKGDNNSFIDPVRVRRSDLVGVLWLHIRHGGVVLTLIHTPLFAALLIGTVGVLCVIGEQERRRRRGRRAPGSSSRPALQITGPVDLRPWLLGAGGVVLAFLALSIFAFGSSTQEPSSSKVSYLQHMQFGYTAAVRPGPVYPDGRVHTGQPVFLHLVHRITLTSSYTLQTGAVRHLSGTEQLALAVAGSTGWTRQFPLGHPLRFAGVRLRSATILDVSAVQALLARVQQLTGVSGDSGASIELVAHVRLHGTLAGRPLDASFAPSFSLELQPLQLQPGSAAGATGAPSAGGLDQSKPGSVSVPGTKPRVLAALGASISIAALRPLALLGFLLSLAALIVLALLARLRAPFGETARIKSRYGHLIVPIVAAPDTLERVPFDVTSIEALVRLAESGERLILHHRDPVGDTYLVNDDTGLYRYQVGPRRVAWGQWQPPRPPAGYEEEPAVGVPVAPRPTFLEPLPAEPGDANAGAGAGAVAQAVASPPTAGVPLSAYLHAPAPRRRVTPTLWRVLWQVTGARRG